MSILIVEDDPNDLMLTGRLLYALGFDVISSGTANQARQFLIMQVAEYGERPYDLVLIDLRLIGSDINGADIARICQEIAPKMPVVMFTGWESMRAFEELTQLRYVSVAFKPLTEETFIRILDRHKIQWKHRKQNEKPPVTD